MQGGQGKYYPKCAHVGLRFILMGVQVGLNLSSTFKSTQLQTNQKILVKQHLNITLNFRDFGDNSRCGLFTCGANGSK